MLNDKKYKIPKNTSGDNQILWIINGLERKLKTIKDILRKDISCVSKCEEIDLILK